MPGGDRPERIERPEAIEVAPPERVERVEVSDYSFDRPERMGADYQFERAQDVYNPEYFDPFVGYQPNFGDSVGYSLGSDFYNSGPGDIYNPADLGVSSTFGYDTDSARGMDTSNPAQELDWWEKFKTNLSQAFTPGNVGRNLAMSAMLNLATGGTATPLMLLGGTVAGGVAGAGGRTVAEQLPDEYAGARNFLGSATSGGIGSLLYGQNPLIGAAAGGLSRVGSDVTREAVGGEMGDILAGAVGGGIRTGIRGGEFSEGAESGMYGAALESAMTGGASGNVPGSEGRAPGGSGMSELGRMMLLGRGLYGMREAREMRRAGEEAARMADPWGTSGGRGRADAQLQALLADPQTAAMNDPAFKLRLQAAQRAAAVQGADSGAMAVAAANASTDWYNQRLAQLGGISGAGVNPATAAELRMAGRRQGADLASQSLATLGYGMAMRG